MTYRYADGTSGHTGSEASEERVRDMDANGSLPSYRDLTLEWLGARGAYGATQAELQARLSVGHGTASQVLSTLHQAERVQRLSSKRLRSHVYVLPEYTLGRPLSGYRRLQSREVLRTRIADLEGALAQVLQDIPQHLPEYAASVVNAKRVLHDRLADD